MKVAILAGGRSSERQASLITADTIREAVVTAGHTADLISVERSGVWRFHGRPISLSPGAGLLDADVVFPTVHGPLGEDGTVQGLLELLDVPYVGAGVLASSLCADRAALREMLAAGGVPQVPYLVVREHAWRRNPRHVHATIAGLQAPLSVKPARLGSPAQITMLEDRPALDESLERTFAHDGVAVVEELHRGVEVTCGIIGLAEPAVSVLGQIIRGDAGRHQHRPRRTPSGSTLRIPASISAEVTAEVRRVAGKAFVRVGCAGLARADVFVDGNRVAVNEINTVPDLGPASDVAKLWQASGVELPALCERLLGLALDRFRTEHGGYRM